MSSNQSLRQRAQQRQQSLTQQVQASNQSISRDRGLDPRERRQVVAERASQRLDTEVQPSDLEARADEFQLSMGFRRGQAVEQLQGQTATQIDRSDITQTQGGFGLTQQARQEEQEAQVQERVQELAGQSDIFGPGDFTTVQEGGETVIQPRESAIESAFNVDTDVSQPQQTQDTRSRSEIASELSEGIPITVQESEVVTQNGEATLSQSARDRLREAQAAEQLDDEFGGTQINRFDLRETDSGFRLDQEARQEVEQSQISSAVREFDQELPLFNVTRDDVRVTDEGIRPTQELAAERIDVQNPDVDIETGDVRQAGDQFILTAEAAAEQFGPDIGPEDVAFADGQPQVEQVALRREAAEDIQTQLSAQLGILDAPEIETSDVTETTDGFRLDQQARQQVQAQVAEDQTADQSALIDVPGIAGEAVSPVDFDQTDIADGQLTTQAQTEAIAATSQFQVSDFQTPQVETDAGVTRNPTAQPQLSQETINEQRREQAAEQFRNQIDTGLAITPDAVQLGPDGAQLRPSVQEGLQAEQRAEISQQQFEARDDVAAAALSAQTGLDIGQDASRETGDGLELRQSVVEGIEAQEQAQVAQAQFEQLQDITQRVESDTDLQRGEDFFFDQGQFVLSEEQRQARERQETLGAAAQAQGVDLSTEFSAGLEGGVVSAEQARQEQLDARVGDVAGVDQQTEFGSGTSFGLGSATRAEERVARQSADQFSSQLGFDIGPELVEVDQTRRGIQTSLRSDVSDADLSDTASSASNEGDFFSGAVSFGEDVTGLDAPGEGSIANVAAAESLFQSTGLTGTIPGAEGVADTLGEGGEFVSQQIIEPTADVGTFLVAGAQNPELGGVRGAQAAQEFRRGNVAQGFESLSGRAPDQQQGIGEAFTFGTIQGAGEVANVPELVGAGVTAADIGATGVSRTAQGEGGEFAAELGGAGALLATRFGETAASNPSRTSGMLAGGSGGSLFTTPVRVSRIDVSVDGQTTRLPRPTGPNVDVDFPGFDSGINARSPTVEADIDTTREIRGVAGNPNVDVEVPDSGGINIGRPSFDFDRAGVDVDGPGLERPDTLSVRGLRLTTPVIAEPLTGSRNIQGTTIAGARGARPTLGTPEVDLDRVDVEGLGQGTSNMGPVFEPITEFETDVFTSSAATTGGEVGERIGAVRGVLSEGETITGRAQTGETEPITDVIRSTEEISDDVDADALADTLADVDATVFGSGAVRAQAPEFRDPGDIDIVVPDKSEAKAEISETIEGTGTGIDAFDIKESDSFAGLEQGEIFGFGRRSQAPIETEEGVRVNPIGEELQRKAGASGFFRAPGQFTEDLDVGPRPNPGGGPRTKDVEDTALIGRELLGESNDAVQEFETAFGLRSAPDADVDTGTPTGTQTGGRVNIFGTDTRGQVDFGQAFGRPRADVETPPRVETEIETRDVTQRVETDSPSPFLRGDADSPSPRPRGDSDSPSPTPRSPDRAPSLAPSLAPGGSPFGSFGQSPTSRAPESESPTATPNSVFGSPTAGPSNQPSPAPESQVPGFGGSQVPGFDSPSQTAPSQSPTGFPSPDIPGTSVTPGSPPTTNVPSTPPPSPDPSPSPVPTGTVGDSPVTQVPGFTTGFGGEPDARPRFPEADETDEPESTVGGLTPTGQRLQNPVASGSQFLFGNALGDSVGGDSQAGNIIPNEDTEFSVFGGDV